MKFSRLESGLYLELAVCLQADAPLQAYEYEGGYRSGYFVVGADDPIYLVFSFPGKTDDCYLLFTDGDPVEFAKQMASLQEYNEQTTHLCNGHTVPTSNPYLREAGWVSYLVTVPTVAHERLPSTASIHGRDLRLHLVIPLCEAEYRVKLERGLDALMRRFEESDRDIVSFVRG